MITRNILNCLFVFLIATFVACFVGSAEAANLLGYYEFENNDFDSSSAGNNAIPAGSVGFAAGFRGAASRDLTGGQINLPPNANPGVNDEISFGGWANIDLTGFRGFMAIDNGGWDRGVYHNRAAGRWGIASGGNSDAGPTATVGQWQYVVGTFNKTANRATLYVGDANPSTQTTGTLARADAGSGPSETVIELGRYDNQVFDGQADDIFVFDSELTADEANAVRNLRLGTTDYSPIQAEALFDLFDAGSGSLRIFENGQKIEWSLTSGLSTTNPGELFDIGDGGFALVLDGAGSGLNGALVPEPSTMILAVLALGGFGLFSRRRRCRV